MNSELRAASSRVPPVVGQIVRYRQAIRNYKTDIESSYPKVCNALLRLDEMRKRAGAKQNLLPSDTHKLLSDAADGTPLQTDEEPRLIAFGYDGDQKRSQRPLGKASRRASYQRGDRST